MTIFENNLATIQGMELEAIALNNNIQYSSLNLEISPRSEHDKDSKLGFGKLYNILFTNTHSKTYEVTQYLVGAFDNYDEAMKCLKKFQRVFKKTTGYSLLKNRFNHITNEPIWSCYIK